MELNTEHPVMITGATGYVAGWIVKRLLDAGFTVHAPVRDPGNKEKLKYLDALAAEAPGNIKYFKADLLEEGSYAEAMAGCRVVFHTASPFKLEIKDPQRELVDPAVKGTKNVLNEVKKNGGVERVVLTSSCAAVYTDNSELKDTKSGAFTEEIWNETASLSHQPYCLSKTLAERAAWELAEGQPWKLVVINPSLVLGPGINPRGTSESFNFVKQLGDGSLKAGLPNIGFGIIDVRDLAEAHFNAAFMEEASGRNIVSGHDSNFLQLAQLLQPKWGERFPIPKRALPKWLVWLVGPLANSAVTRRYVRDNVNLPWRGDSSKAVRELKMSFRPLSDSVNEMFAQLVETGQLG